MEWFLIWILCGCFMSIFIRSVLMPSKQEDGTVMDYELKDYLADPSRWWVLTLVFVLGPVTVVLYFGILIYDLFTKPNETLDIFPIRVFTPSWTDGVKDIDGKVYPTDEWMADHKTRLDEIRQIRWHTLGKKMATIKKHLDDPNFKFFTW